MTQTDIKTWDIFCRVIDNYGDIGVCWRLARQLAHEYPCQVRLWVDDIQALMQIWPVVQDSEEQWVENVDICIWHPTFNTNVDVADVVIEAFACHLPDTYLAAMKLQPAQWFNLEYLSAEDWIEGCHGLLSVHPQLGLEKTFFFPGFTTRTGGLVREHALFAERDLFNQNNTRTQFLQTLGIEYQSQELIVSLFSYENTALNALLATWIQSSTPILCLVPPGKILPGINDYLGQVLDIGDEFIKGSLRLKVIPFLTQTDYDCLLWSCDINFVRGEDSFVRSQWAARPFVWHIYPQDDHIHTVKLDVFLQKYLQTMEPADSEPISTLLHQWNLGKDCEESWNACLVNLPKWQKHAVDWCHYLDSLDDLAANLVAVVNKSRQKTL